MKFNALAGKSTSIHAESAFLRIVSLVLLLSFVHGQAETQSSVGYYLRMKSDDFTRMMLPKEKFLLGLVKTVHEELDARRKEGESLTQLGLQNLVHPEERLVRAYHEELRKMESLLETIENLERLARRKSNFEILEGLAGIKRQMRESLGGRSDMSTDSLAVRVATHEPDSGRGALSESSSSAASVSHFWDPNGDNLFEQWKYNRLLDYKARLTKYQLLRKRLFENATSAQKQRLFQRELKQALSSYNANDFRVARLQLDALIRMYRGRYKLDDLIYYAAETSYGLHYFDEALDQYNRVIRLYPASEFAIRAMVKRLYIYSIYDDMEKQSEIYQRLLVYRSQIDAETWGTVTYLFGYSLFRAGRYRSALEALARLDPDMSYYYPGLYLSAACYSNLENDAGAISIYQRLISQADQQNDPILRQIKNNALLKMGLIYYERGDMKSARASLSRIEHMQSGELVLLGKAWLAFQDNRPGEALRNAETLLKQNMVSNYIYEARVLAASSKQLLGKREEALDDLKHIFESGQKTQNIKNAASNDRSREAALESNEQLLMREAHKMRQLLGVQRLPSQSVMSESDDLQREIDRLDAMESLAMERNNLASLSEIRQLRGQMIEAVQAPAVFPESGGMDPLIQHMGMSEYLNFLFRSLMIETLNEKEKTKRHIQEAGTLLDQANAREKTNIALQMEIRLDELHEYYNYLNRNEIWLKENAPQEMQVEVGHWANFSGYGISNINFSRIKEIEERQSKVSTILASVDRTVTRKREALETRIQHLLGDVERIEHQIREESTKNEDQERERLFKRGYFDKRVRETASD